MGQKLAAIGEFNSFWMFYTRYCTHKSIFWQNSEDPDEKPQKAPFHKCLCCLVRCKRKYILKFKIVYPVNYKMVKYMPFASKRLKKCFKIKKKGELIQAYRPFVGHKQTVHTQIIRHQIVASDQVLHSFLTPNIILNYE